MRTTDACPRFRLLNFIFIFACISSGCENETRKQYLSEIPHLSIDRPELCASFVISKLDNLRESRNRNVVITPSDFRMSDAIALDLFYSHWFNYDEYIRVIEHAIKTNDSYIIHTALHCTGGIHRLKTEAIKIPLAIYYAHSKHNFISGTKLKEQIADLFCGRFGASNEAAHRIISGITEHEFADISQFVFWLQFNFNYEFSVTPVDPFPPYPERTAQ